MEQAPGQACPRCGTARIGNFRWCRTCGNDFDADRVGDPASRPTFVLTPHPALPRAVAPPPAPVIAPSTPAAQPTIAPPWSTAPPPAASAPADPRATVASTSPPKPAAARPSPSRRSALTAVIVALVGVVFVIAVGLWRGAGITAGPTGTPLSSSAATPGGSPVASEPVLSDAQRREGDGTIEFPVTPGRAGIATIVHEGSGPFAVWTLGAGGSDEEQLVDAEGPYTGIKLFN